MAEGTFTRTTRKLTAPPTYKSCGYWDLRTAAVLTTAYVASSHARVGGHPTMTLFLTISDAVDYTSIEVIVEGSEDEAPAASEWGVLPADATNIARSYTLSALPAATDRRIAIPVSTSGLRSLRFWIKRTGGTAVGTVAGIAVGGVGV